MSALLVSLPSFLTLLITLSVLLHNLLNRNIVNFRVSVLILTAAVAITLTGLLQRFSLGIEEYLFFTRLQILSLSIMPGCILTTSEERQGYRIWFIGYNLATNLDGLYP